MQIKMFEAYFQKIKKRNAKEVKTYFPFLVIIKRIWDDLGVKSTFQNKWIDWHPNKLSNLLKYLICGRAAIQIQACLPL